MGLVRERQSQGSEECVCELHVSIVGEFEGDEWWVDGWETEDVGRTMVRLCTLA